MSVVVEALTTEYIKVRNRLDGARKRHHFAISQQESEAELIRESEQDLAALGAAIEQAGGEPPEHEEPYDDG